MTPNALPIALFLAGWAGWIVSPAVRAAAQADAIAGAGATQATRGGSGNATAIFRFETDEFWLNLHHFLYVLGRAEAKEQDASRDAVAGAPAEAEKGLAALSDEERQAWRAAVTAYSGGLSKKDTVRDSTLPALTAALARAGDAPALARPSQSQQADAAGAAAAAAEAGAIDAGTRATLERVAPIYRRVWWPAHRASNHAWRTAQALVDRHGRALSGLQPAQPSRHAASTTSALAGTACARAVSVAPVLMQ